MAQAATEQGSAAGWHKGSARVRSGRQAAEEEVGEGKLAFEVDPKAMVVYTNFKYRKMWKLKYKPRYIGIPSGSQHELRRPYSLQNHLILCELGRCSPHSCLKFGLRCERWWWDGGGGRALWPVRMLLPDDAFVVEKILSFLPQLP